MYDDPKNKERFKKLLNDDLVPKVKGSDLIPKPYNEDKIREALKRETGLEGEIADKLVESVSRYLISNKIKIITSPMIREIVNSFCLQFKLETIRLKHTRIGMPKWDLDNVYNKNGNINYIEESMKLINLLIEKIVRTKNNNFVVFEGLVDWILKEVEKIKETIEKWYDSSDKKILDHIKKENENVDNLIKILEGENNGN